MVEDALKKFCKKNVAEPYMKAYIEICISIAFFRVPHFRSLFLDCVHRTLVANECAFPEWRNINWSLEEHDNQ